MTSVWQTGRPAKAIAAPTRRGGGLLAIVLLVVSWSIARAAFWESPFLPTQVEALSDGLGALVGGTSPPGEAQGTRSQPSDQAPLLDPPAPVLDTWSPEPVLAPFPEPMPIPVAMGSPQAAAYTLQRANLGGNRMLGHANLLRMGYYVSPSVGGGNVAEIPSPVPAPALVYASAAASELRATPVQSRWSIDAWALWREGGNVPLVLGQQSYGRSQAGAVVRYRLGDAGGYAPQLHLRGTSALEGAREREVAMGASVRPIPSLPVRLAAEGRVNDTDIGTELRVAGYAVTELPPIQLPAGLTGEVYAQAGYVTGNSATPFADGQARITRPVVRRDDFRLEAGAGAWGGAQENAQRLDIGPSASLAFRIGNARGRVSADYRFRVAGEAEPASGPALTVTAGF